MTRRSTMSPQTYKNHITTKAMTSNGYNNTETPIKESKNHSSPCELFKCMCA